MPKSHNKVAPIVSVIAIVIIILLLLLYSNEKISASQVLVGASITVALSLIVTVVFIFRYGDDITPRQRKRDERLKVHFEDMQKGGSNIIPPLAEDYGQIYLFNSALNNLNLHKFPPEFTAHFPQEDNAWNTYCLDITKHNEKYAEFILKIREAFEQYGLKVNPCDERPKSPCICEAIYRPLFAWWRDRLKQNPQVDFAHIDIDISSGQIANLYVAGWGYQAIAYAENETDKKKCKHIIREVANNSEYEQEATNLLASAIRLVDSVRTLNTKLADTILSTDKFWPGTKDYKFRRVKCCQVCQNIFD